MTAASRDDDDDGDPPAVSRGLHSHCLLSFTPVVSSFFPHLF